MIRIRVATAEDGADVNRVLTAAFGSMSRYDPELLAAVLPAMGRIDTAVLTSGTYYVAEADGRIEGVGGWTFQRPGGRGEAILPDVAHIRYVGIDPSAGRRGVGRRLIEHGLAEAAAAGVAVMHSYSTLGAEPFYSALGFEVVGPITSHIAGHAVPGTHMTRRIG